MIVAGRAQLVLVPAWHNKSCEASKCWRCRCACGGLYHGGRWKDLVEPTLAPEEEEEEESFPLFHPLQLSLEI